MSKFSSFKEHQLITESWRKFLDEDNGEEVEAAEASPEADASSEEPSAEDMAQVLEAPGADVAADKLLANLPPEVLGKIDDILAKAESAASASQGVRQEDQSESEEDWLQKYVMTAENLIGLMWAGIGGAPFGALAGEQVIKALSTGPLAQHAVSMGYVTGGAVAVASFVAAVLAFRRSEKKSAERHAAFAALSDEEKAQYWDKKARERITDPVTDFLAHPYGKEDREAAARKAAQLRSGRADEPQS